MSGAFPLPAYQNSSKVPKAPKPKGFKGRGVPDVTGDGDPDTGYNILVDGQPVQEGGTSAVAPLWAALIAIINQKLKGRVGFVNPQLYALPAGVRRVQRHNGRRQPRHLQEPQERRLRCGARMGCGQWTRLTQRQQTGGSL